MAATLDADGFEIREGLPSTIVRALLDLFASLEVRDDLPFYASCNDSSPEESAQIHAGILERLGPVLTELMLGGDPFLAGFVCKQPGAGPLSFHQDLSYTDERVHRARISWIPLVDVDDEGGSLRLVPGSHRWTRGARPALAELPTEPHQDAFASRSVARPVRTGTVVTYDAATVHGSHPNLHRIRPAVAVASVPHGAPLLHCLPDGDGALQGFPVDSAYYVRQSLWSPPLGIEPVEPWAPAVASVDFEAELRRPLPVSSPAQ